jgi:hypothetical protein
MKKRIFCKVVIALIVVVMTALSAPSFAGNVTVPPSMMPNFPMLAGPNVMIMWIPVPGAVNYKVYMNGKLVGEAPAPPLTIPAPTDAGVYKYVLTGVDAAGEEGPKSQPSSLTIIKLIQPKNINGQMLGDPVRVLNLRWDAVPSAAIYDIYRSDKKDGEYKLISSITETRYVDSDIKDEKEFQGKTFYYKIVSKDKFNNPSPDTEIFEFKVPKQVERDVLKDISLKIRRSKLVRVAKPLSSDHLIKSVIGSSLTFDKREMIYSDRFGHTVGVMDEFGDWQRTFAEVGPKPGQIEGPGSITVDKEGDVYIVDNRGKKFKKFSSDGTLIYSADQHVVVEEEAIRDGKGKPQTNVRLIGISVYDGKLYGADTWSGTVQIYDAENGDFLGYFSNKETGKVNNFGAATSTLIGGGKLYVGKPLSRIVNVYDFETGVRLYDIGKSKTFIGAFAAVNGMVFDPDGNVMVADTTMHATQVFSGEDGSYMYHLGDEKAIPDPRAKDQRAVVNGLDSPMFPDIDYKGRVWIYSGSSKGYYIREWVSDDIWDALVDKPEGSLKGAKKKKK